MDRKEPFTTDLKKITNVGSEDIPEITVEEMNVALKQNEELMELQ